MINTALVLYILLFELAAIQSEGVLQNYAPYNPLRFFNTDPFLQVLDERELKRLHEISQYYQGNQKKKACFNPPEWITTIDQQTRINKPSEFNIYSELIQKTPLLCNALEKSVQQLHQVQLSKDRKQIACLALANKSDRKYFEQAKIGYFLQVKEASFLAASFCWSSLNAALLQNELDESNANIRNWGVASQFIQIKLKTKLREESPRSLCEPLFPALSETTHTILTKKPNLSREINSSPHREVTPLEDYKSKENWENFIYKAPSS